MTVTVIIDRIKIPVYETVDINQLEDRELVFESSTNSLVIKNSDSLIKIPYEPAIIEALWLKLKEYIETNSMIVSVAKPESPADGSIYYDLNDQMLYIYINGQWKPVIP